MTDWESGQATVRRQVPLKACPGLPRQQPSSRISDVSAGFPRPHHYVTINKSNSQVSSRRVRSKDQPQTSHLFYSLDDVVT